MLRYVSERGPVSASTLAELLDLTQPAVRRHLDALVAAGEIALGGGHGPRGRGRPARSYVVTPAGHRRLDTDYADLAVAALRFVADQLGPSGVAEFARRRFDRVHARYVGAVSDAGANPQDRAEALAQALAADGFAASTRPVGMDTPLAGVQLCQGHCPMQRVAAEFPQLCEAEAGVFADLLGVRVQRLATQAQGAHACTTFIPLTPDRPPVTALAADPDWGRATPVADHAPTDLTIPPPADERTQR